MKSQESPETWEERYRLLVELMDQGVVIHDFQGNIVSANPKATQLFGLPKDVGENGGFISIDKKLVDETGRMMDSGRLPFSVVVETGKPVRNFVFGVYENDDSLIWLRAHSIPHAPNEDEAKGWIFSTFEDITPFKRAVSDMNESGRTALALLNATTDLAMLLNEKGYMLAVNETAGRIFGKGQTELIGMKLAPLLPEKVVRSRKDFVLKVLRTEKPVNFEENVFDAHWDVSVFPISTSRDTDRSMALFARDVTQQRIAEKERTELEQQLLQSQKLEAIGTLAGGIAHDFNNLLTGIIGNINIAQLEADDRIRPFLNNAETAAMRAASLVSQLLTFSRKSQSEFKIVNPQSIVREIAGLLRETIDRRISVEMKAFDDPWLIYADSNQIHQVVMSLCINSRDAIKGQLDVRSEKSIDFGTASYRIQIELSQKELYPGDLRPNPEASPGKYVVISVIDNGPGMTEEVRARIFEPFFTTKEQGKGTGLGLATVFGIVKQHKGWIDVESTPGQGSSFHVYLPVHKSEGTAKTRTLSFEETPGGQETILLVDDEKIVRELGKAILKRKGYDVLLAEDGKRGLELFAKEKENISLVILDQTMPYLSGKELLQQIMMLRPSTRVLMSSGYVDPDQEKQFIDMGAVGFVAKPYTIEDLSRNVRKALDD